jgi:hypothetical protein
VGGVVGGATVAAVGARSSQPAPGADGSAKIAAERPRTLEARVEALERSVSVLRRDSRAARVVAAYGAALADDGDDADAAPSGSVVDDPVFEAAVRDVIEQIDTQRQSERRAARQERRQLAAKRWTDQLARDVRLNEAQKAKVAEIVVSFFESLRELREADGGPATRDEWRAHMTRLREQGEQRLAQVLDHRQMEQYRTLGDERRLGVSRRSWDRRQE